MSAAAQTRKLTRSAPPKIRVGASGSSPGSAFDLEIAGQRLGLTQEQVASALNLSAQTTRHWDSETEIYQTNKSTRDLCELLSRMDEYVVASKEKDWLSSPLKALGGRSPRELIIEGRIRELITEFDRLREGQPV